MTETPEQRRSRLRWITLGEAIAIAALIISGLGLWREWSKRDERPATVVEQRQQIPLTLRGTVEDEGRVLEIAPVESGHALQSLGISFRGSKAVIDLGSDGRLSSRQVERIVEGLDESHKGTGRKEIRISARYVEAGQDRVSTGTYVLTYRWEGGGLFGGRSVRLTGLSR